MLQYLEWTVSIEQDHPVNSNAIVSGTIIVLFYTVSPPLAIAPTSTRTGSGVPTSYESSKLPIAIASSERVFDIHYDVLYYERSPLSKTHVL